MKFSIERVYSKGVSKINEDGILIKNNLFGVFDGAGSLVKFLNKDGKTGGKIASEIARNTFSKNNDSLKNLAIKANNIIREEMEKNKINFLKKENLWGTTAAVVRVKKDFAEFFQIGDSLILVVLKNNKPKLIAKYNDHDKETMIKWKELADKKEKNIWKKINKKIIMVRRKSNVTYGFLNGDKKAIKFFNTGKFRLENVKFIILFTDGLLLPKKDPRRNEDWNKFASIYKKSDLNGLLGYVRSTESADPNCLLYPRFKKHDDIAAIAIRLR
jgi:serine/threonine protein phosphatase PrpC